MNKMVIFVLRHPKFPDVFIKGLVDGDYLFDEEAKQYGEGIIQYYQGGNLRWRFPVNPFMKGSIRWSSYEGLKEIISKDEEAFAHEVFKGDKNVTKVVTDEMRIEREVLTW
jgi:hypothetical protein